MPNQGPNSPTTGVNDTGVGTQSWTTPGNITASDDTRATLSAGGAVTSHYLKATGFGFSIPAGATIDGILVEWERNGSVGIGTDNSVRMVKGGVVAGDEKADIVTGWPASDAYASYGGATDLWGLTWVPADFSGGGFGAVLSASASGIGTLALDHVRITVYYTDLVPAQQTRWGCPTNHPGFWDE